MPMPHCSGDMYFSVPMIVPTRVRLVLVPVASSSGLGMRIAAPDASLRARAGLEDLGDAEIEDLDVAVVENEDVVGLEVAVDDAVAVRRPRARAASRT